MKKISFVAAIVLASFVCGLISAQQVTEVTEVTTVTPVEPAKQRFDIGAGYWYTWASLDYYAYASSDVPGYYLTGDKISELNNDIDAGLFIVNAEAWIWWRLYVDGFVAWGDFEGDHDDSDWYPQYSTDLLSFSSSDADGDVVTWNVNGLLRIIDEPEDKGYLDVSLGYFYYRDDIEHLRNSTLLITSYVNVNTPIAGHDSSDEYTFSGLRLGVRGKIRLHDRVAIKLNAGLCPWLDMDDEKFWNLRDDYGLPAGMEAEIDTEGSSFDLTLGVEFKITKNLFIEGGYKYMNFDSDIGDDDRSWRSGVSVTYEDAGEMEAERGGFYGMGRLKF